MTTAMRIAGLMSGISFLATASAALAQTVPESSQAETDDSEIVVIGSQIRGADIAGALPVTVLNEDEIAAIGATSGDDLFRSIPQAGDVAFNESRDSGGINDARGDTASVNLRALGTGNTLVLLNGRRMILHPGTQNENQVPTQSVNTNTIPVLGVRRVEVLLDGAAAIYGSDAVAGVINTVLKSDFEGLRATSELGFTEDSGQVEAEFAFEAGHRFNGGKSSISLFGSYNHRDALYARDRRNSRSADLRPLLVGTPFEGDTDFDNGNSNTIWGEFQRLTDTYAVSTAAAQVNGTALTTNGIFHIQPDINSGCIASTPYAGTCWDNSTLQTASTDNNLKYNINNVRTVIGRNDRINLFSFFNHEFDGGLEFFAEAAWYRADYQSQREQDTAMDTQRLIIPANGYYNPLGPIGSRYRIPGLTGVAAAGVPIELQDYRPVDAGPLIVNVRNDTMRFLGGFRGNMFGFDFDSAVLYSRSRTRDSMHTLSATKFQQALSRTDSSAYNPFNGGDPLNPGLYDGTANPQSVIDSFMVDIYRIGTTELAMADFKVSKNDLLTLPAGRVGMAAGVEFRRETFADDRDPRLDGTIVFTALDGSTNGSDAFGASPTPDSSGARNTISSFLEFAVPLVRPDMNVPLVSSLDVQLAGRVESYEGFSTVAKPKVAVSWYPVRNLQFRGSWSQGFRAPNLPQLFESGIQRSNARTDWVKCEADRRAGRITNFDACARSQSIVSNRSGNLALLPDESDNLSVGGTFQFNMGQAGRLTFTADYWEIRQKNVVGLFGDANALILDYLLRLSGSSNPDVQRAAPTQQDVLDFAGTGIAPVGRVIQVVDNYSNLDPRRVRGYDLGVYYQVKDTGFGDFSARVNAARLLEFHQVPGPAAQALLDAQASGTIDRTISVTGAQSIVEQNGRPKWRASASFTWRYNGFGIGYHANYVGGVTDTSALLADGTRFRVDDYLTHNLYAQYNVDGGPMDDLRLRVGMRNLLNDAAPVADQNTGYLGELYGNRGRQIYLSVSKGF